MDPLEEFWSISPNETLKRLRTSAAGLTSAEARRRAPPKKQKAASPFKKDLLLFLRQFKSPLVLLLLFSLILSSVLSELGDSLVIFIVLFLTGIVGYVQERNASKAVEHLRSLVSAHAAVRRDGAVVELLPDQVVPGDIVELNAGDIVPGDGMILRSKDLYVNESVLTGESFPAEKLSSPDLTGDRKQAVFRGTNVISGTADVVIVAIGGATQMGMIEKEIEQAAPETAFERGVRQFGNFIMRVAVVLAGLILAYNLIMGKPPRESFLFALALSIGLTPELLPSIITITLSAGAKRLASKKVIVKKLASIQNLGAIDVLCSDKTGTLTEGEIRIHSYQTSDGATSDRLKLFAFLNATFESGFSNPIDDAIRREATSDISGYLKLDEVPYDFIRKRLSIVVSKENRHLMITKGSLKSIVAVCTQVELHDGIVQALDEQNNKILQEHYDRYSRDGYRVLGVCFKDVTDDPVITKEDEQGMIFLGFILLTDPLKPNITQTIAELEASGVTLKLITGDNALIAHHVADQLQISPPGIITGEEIHRMSDEALVRNVRKVDIFAETEPSQKERIVRALQKAGYVVGYLGDGINDASALKTADVGITVNNAVDVAKDAADMILTEKTLQVLCDGIAEGRKTYLNTLKYIFITISANFGNMVSMAIAAVLLPFLPLLPMQVLLVNFLTDLPALALASDNVDRQMLDKPRKWDIKLIRNFMFVFGLESSLFDFLIFAILLYVFHATPEVFRTGWFAESVLTEVLILLVIRTRGSVLRSKPGILLIVASVLVIAIVTILPLLPITSRLFQFTVLPDDILLAIAFIGVGYMITGEITKRFLFKKLKF